MSSPFAFLPSLPDPAARQPFTTASFFLPYLPHYVLAVLAILPNTFILKVAVFPIVLWQAWNCAVGHDAAVAMANSLGYEDSTRLRHWNFALVGWFFILVLRSLAWTVAEKPLRRYNPPVQDQDGSTTERPLSIPNVLLDALDLMFNLRGIGWSWSHKPFPKSAPSSTSIPNILATLFLKFLAFDTAQCLMHHVRPSTNLPEGDTIFDPTLSFFPRYFWAGFCTVCGAVMVYTMIDMFYHIITFIGLVLLREPEWRWPPLTQRPWMSTSVADFWSLRWHQIFRYIFVSLGSRPFGALLGRPGAVLGAFGVSAVMHDVGMWGLGNGTEFSAAAGFFMFMGVGAVLEYGFKKVTGYRVRGIWGWLWTMVWSISWGTLLIDAWARRGMMASDFFPYAPHPGKLFIDALVSL